MSLKHLLDLTGGHNDIVEPELIGDNQVKDSQNYEVLGQGGLTVRKEPEAYSATLNTYISTTLGMATVTSISPPIYPQVKLASGGTTYQTNEFCLVVYGTLTAGGSYEMYLVYGITGGLSWAHKTTGATGTDLLAGLTSAGVDWTSSCKPEYSINNNRMVITDGVNKAYYIEVDSDGTVVCGTLGIPAPTARPVVIDYEIGKRTANSGLTTAEGESLFPTGLVHVVYTIVDKLGNESNPSPVSQTIDLQWNSLDVDFVQDKWVARLPITGLILPTLSTVERAMVKYFRVYVRSVRYASDSYSGTLEMAQQFPVTDGYVSVVVNLPVESGNIVSYENDEAPVAHHCAQVSGVTFLGGIEETLEFGMGTPDYYVPITITNAGDDYVDAIVRIRLTEAGVTSLDWSDYITGGSINMPTDPDDLDAAAINKVRMIDQNKNSPLNVYMEGDVGNTLVDVYVKIPYLPNGDYTIYFAWGATAWVSGTLSTAYGQWTDSSSFSTATTGAQTVMWGDFTRTPSINTLIAAPCNLLSLASYFLTGGTTGVENRVDISNSASMGVLTLMNNAGTLPSITDISMIGKLGTTKSVLKTKSNPHVELGGLTATAGAKFINNGLGAIPRKGTVYFNLYNPTNTAAVDHSIFAMYNKTDADPLLMLKLEKTTGNWWYSVEIDGGADDNFIAIRGEADVSASHKPYFICFSWDDDASTASLFLADNDANFYGASEIAIDDIPVTDFTEGIISFGGVETTSAVVPVGAAGAGNLARFDEMVFIVDKYYDGSVTADKDAVYNIASGMAPFASAVGYSKTGGTHNNNISIGDTETTETTSYLNKIKWTEPNGVNFPDLYSKYLREPIKAQIASPSFLKFQYENTLVILTRNTITRFLLDGEPNTWVGDANALVEEGFNAGVYAIDTLCKARDSMLWMAENGLIMWNQEGFRNLSQNVIDITLQDEDNLVGFYQPIRDQYILHDRTNDISYVYHMRYGTFYKFKGLQLDKGIPRVLSGGTEDENVNLMIWQTRDIYKYPGKTDTTETAFIETKAFDHIRAVFRRFRFYFTGNPTIASHVIDNTLDPTELMPNQADRDFSGTPAWANVDLDSYSESGSLAITAVAVGQYCACPIASMPMTAGVEYTLEYDYSVTKAGIWALQDFTGAQEFARVESQGTDQLLTFTPNTGITGGLRIVAIDEDPDGEFDNFSLKTRDRNESNTPTSGVYNWITNGKNLGEKIYFKITGAKSILSGMYEYLSRGAR